MLPIPLIGPSYESRQLPLSAQVTKNMYAQIDGEARVPVSLQSFPGLKDFASGLTGRFRGHSVMAGVYYVVCGTVLSSVASDGSNATIGTINGKDRVLIAHDGETMMIVTGGDWYQYTLSTGVLAENPDADLVNPTTVAYINAQFIFDNNSDTSVAGEFVSTSIDKSIDALDFATAESHPDDLIRTFTHNQLVYMFGGVSVEPWYNSGVGRPPFDRVQGGSRKIGIAGRDAITEQGDVMYILDDERVPRKVLGFESAPIGSPALGKAFDSYDTVSDCVLYSFTLDHQEFVVYHFTDASRTWLYHVPSASWSQLSDGVGLERFRGVGYAKAYGKHLVPDRDNGKIYELDYATYTYNGESIHRKRVTANMHGGLYGAPGRTMFFGKVEFVMQVGEGIPTGQGSDPKLMVRYSDDGGLTYSPEQWYSLGVGGDYLRRVEMYQQGRAQQRLYELTYSEPTPFTLLSAHADISFS